MTQPTQPTQPSEWTVAAHSADPEMRNAHNLMPLELALLTPKLYATEEIADPMVMVKWFTPDSSWTWYVIEFSHRAPDGSPNLAFALVDGLDVELGYVSLAEVQGARGHLGLQVERDLWWTPKPLSQVRAELREQGKGY